MAFIRHIDPKDSMQIGRKQDSTEIIGAQFSIDGSSVRLKTPELIFDFLKKLERIEFPDNLYRPHNIILFTKVEIEDRIDDLIRSMSKAGMIPQINPQAILNKINTPPRMRTEIREIRLRSFYGKTIFFSGSFILIPIEKDIQEKAPWLIEDELLEAERIINEKINTERRTKQMAEMMEHEIFSESKRREIELEGKRIMSEILKNSTFLLPRDLKGIIHDPII
jgi:hypothetical protein